MEPSINPDPSITPEIFSQWRDARRGSTSGEDLTNPYWLWLIRSEESSWAANKHFGGKDSYGSQACWSADRFGQSSNLLPDGRRVLIAGEHEDHYDPDFFIYNDIIIEHNDGNIEILGFPDEVFPPTDFHSATLFENEVIVIGNLGYPEQRKIGVTPVLRINITDWSVRIQESSGNMPGWIHDHEVELDGSSLVIRGGKVWVNGDAGLLQNFDDWKLDLTTWNWERLTQREVTILEAVRDDEEPNQLFEMGMWMFSQEYGKLGSEFSSSEVAPKDIAAYKARYQPSSIDHKELAVDDDHRSTRIEVDGVLVRYDEDMYSIRMIVEGELPKQTMDLLRKDLRGKLEKVEGVPYSIRELAH